MRLNKGLIIILLLNLAIPKGNCAETPDPKAVLTLKQAVLLAFKNNKDVQLQEQEIEASKAQVLGSKSEFLPKVNANASYTHNGSFLNLGQVNSLSSGAKKDIGIFTGYKNDNNVGVSVNQPVYNGGANIAGLRESQLSLKVSDETLTAKKLDVEFEVRRLYYGLLLAFETERITQDLVNQAKSHYEDVKNKYEQGTSSRFDLLQSRVQVSKLMPELIKAKNVVESIKADLKKLIGVKMQESLSVEGKLGYSLIQIDEALFLKQAYLNKPEMILKTLGIDISNWQIQMARAGYRPQINAQGSYNYRSGNLANMFNSRHSNWNAGFSVSVPIFDGFSTKAKVEEAKARYAQANLSKEDLINQIAVDVKQACLDLKQAESIINSQKDNIAEAREALKIAEISYDNGEGTNLDILDAEVSFAQIQKNLSEGIYDYLMAKASLDRSMGTQDFSTGRY